VNEDGIPELVETWKIARAMGWGPDKMASWFQREGLVIQSGKGCARLVKRDELQANFSFVYDKLVEANRAGLLLSGRGGARARQTSQS
jgi:hypothetical protein